MQSVSKCQTLEYKNDSLESLRDERIYDSSFNKNLLYKEASNMDHLHSKYKIAFARNSIGNSLADKIKFGKRSSLGLRKFSRRNVILWI